MKSTDDRREIFAPSASAMLALAPSYPTNRLGDALPQFPCCDSSSKLDWFCRRLWTYFPAADEVWTVDCRPRHGVALRGECS